MSSLTKRNVLVLGLGAALVAGAGLVMNASAGDALFEHTFMPAEEMMAANALVVDIRTPQEWQDTGVVEGAMLVEFDFDNPATFLPQIAADITDGRDLILYCRSGNRTQVVSDYLARQIDNRIVSIKGGIKKVIAAGYSPVPPA